MPSTIPKPRISQALLSQQAKWVRSHVNPKNCKRSPETYRKAAAARTAQAARDRVAKEKQK